MISHSPKSFSSTTCSVASKDIDLVSGGSESSCHVTSATDWICYCNITTSLLLLEAKGPQKNGSRSGTGSCRGRQETGRRKWAVANCAKDVPFLWYTFVQAHTMYQCPVHTMYRCPVHTVYQYPIHRVCQ